MNKTQLNIGTRVLVQSGRATYEVAKVMSLDCAENKVILQLTDSTIEIFETKYILKKFD